MDDHWTNESFTVLKIDMHNAYNLVSRQALLDECSIQFPELLPWASWCYGQHQVLQHVLGTISSEVSVQLGDPLSPMFFCLVLHKIVSAIVSDENCSSLLFHAWYQDDFMWSLVLSMQFHVHSPSSKSMALHWVCLLMLQNINSSVLVISACSNQK